MTNKIVQASLDGKLGFSQNMGEADNRNTLKFWEKFGQGEGDEEVYRQFGKKGQREQMGRGYPSVSNHLPIAPHHQGEGSPSQSVISLVWVTEVCVGEPKCYRWCVTAWGYNREFLLL